MSRSRGTVRRDLQIHVASANSMRITLKTFKISILSCIWPLGIVDQLDPNNTASSTRAYQTSRERGYVFQNSSRKLSVRKYFNAAPWSGIDESSSGKTTSHANPAETCLSSRDMSLDILAILTWQKIRTLEISGTLVWCD